MLQIDSDCSAFVARSIQHLRYIILPGGPVGDQSLDRLRPGDDL